MKKGKEFKLSMIVSNVENKYSEKEIMEMFLDWSNSKGLSVEGIVSEFNKVMPIEN